MKKLLSIIAIAMFSFMGCSNLSNISAAPVNSSQKLYKYPYTVCWYTGYNNSYIQYRNTPQYNLERVCTTHFVTIWVNVD